MKHIGILIFDGVEELDAVGPWEVLAWWTQNFPEDGYRVSFVSQTGGTVEAAKGLTLTPHTSVADAAPFEVFLHPGGRGTRPLMRDPDHIDRVRQVAANRRLAGAERAREVKRGIQYDPHPPV